LTMVDYVDNVMLLKDGEETRRVMNISIYTWRSLRRQQHKSSMASSGHM
jgi:hypothetical protein